MNQGLIEAQVVAGCLVFSGILGDQPTARDRQDLLLYAQLAASKKHSRTGQAQHWMATWEAAMLRFGCVLRDHQTIDLPAAQMGSTTIWDWLRNWRPTGLHVEDIDQAEAVSQRAYLHQPDQAAFQVYAAHVLAPPSALPHAGSVQADPVNLQLGFVREDGALNVTMINFSATQPLAHGFMFEVQQPCTFIGNIAISHYALHLLDERYGLFRELIDSALASRRSGLLWRLRECEV